MLDPDRKTIAAELGKSIATIGRYSKEAINTPYMETDSFPPNMTIYVINWPMIFEHADIEKGRARAMGIQSYRPRPRRRRRGQRLVDEINRLKTADLSAHFGDLSAHFGSSTGSNNDTVSNSEPIQNRADSDATHDAHAGYDHSVRHDDEESYPRPAPPGPTARAFTNCFRAELYQ